MEGQKQQIMEKLRKHGCRITRQRQIILDIILENRCSSCKEIYYQAVRTDDKIGIATVYRMVNALEEIGVISRRIVYETEEEQEGRDGQETGRRGTASEL